MKREDYLYVRAQITSKAMSVNLWQGLILGDVRNYFKCVQDFGSQLFSWAGQLEDFQAFLFVFPLPIKTKQNQRKQN